MTSLSEHSPEVLDKIRELYHEAVQGSVSMALLAAMKFGWELRQRDFDAENAAKVPK
jgi:hypothetical protein